MEKLLSNTEFGFYVRELEINDHKKLELRESYDFFLKQSLTLGMFVPCDLDGNVLKEPKMWKTWLEVYGYNIEGKTKGRYTSQLEARRDCLKYQEAKDRVLFDGFSFNSHFDFVTNGKISFDKNDMPSILIEKLTESELLLTESAKQKIGL